MMQNLINSTNLASILGISNSTVNAWVSNGKISPVKKDSSYLYFDSNKSFMPHPNASAISRFVFSCILHLQDFFLKKFDVRIFSFRHNDTP